MARFTIAVIQTAHTEFTGEIEVEAHDEGDAVLKALARLAEDDFHIELTPHGNEEWLGTMRTQLGQHDAEGVWHELYDTDKE